MPGAKLTCNVHRPVISQQDVSCFDVPVYLSVVVEVVQALQHLLQNCGYGGLIHHTILTRSGFHPTFDDVQHRTCTIFV